MKFFFLFLRKINTCYVWSHWMFAKRFPIVVYTQMVCLSDNSNITCSVMVIARRMRDLWLHTKFIVTVATAANIEDCCSWCAERYTRAMHRHENECTKILPFHSYTAGARHKAHLSSYIILIYNHIWRVTWDSQLIFSHFPIAYIHVCPCPYRFS